MGRDNSRGVRSSNYQPQSEIELFHTGLVNLGNSCFYNAVIQCLSAAVALETTIESPPLSSPALSALSPPTDQEPPTEILSPLPITAAFVNLLSILKQSKSKKSINPKSLLRQLARKHEEYSDSTQQDAHELLMHVLDAMLLEEIDLIKKVTPPPKPKMRSRRGTVRVETGGSFGVISDGGLVYQEEDESESDSSSDSSTDSDSEPEVKKFVPWVENIFGGKLAGFIVCDTCQHVSVTEEDFLDLSLSLKEDKTRTRRRDKIRGFFKSNEPSSLIPQSSRPQSSVSEASETDTEGANSDSGSLVSRLGRRKSLPGNKKSFWGLGSSREPSPSRAASNSSSSRARIAIPRPTSEQNLYLKTVLAEIPCVPSSLPLQLRWATPGKPAPVPPIELVTQSLSQVVISEKVELDSFTPRPNPLAASQTSTDLYQSLREFCKVEILAGANAFACRNCFKLLNPKLVEGKRKKKEEKKGMRRATLVVPAPPPTFLPLSETSSSQLSLGASSGNITDDEASRAGIDADVDVSAASEDGNLNFSDGNLTDSAETKSIPSIIEDDGSKLPLTVENVAALESPSLKKVAESTTTTSHVGKKSLPKVLPPKAARHIMRQASKRYLISPLDLPPVLVIHLKRFQQTSKSSLFSSSAFLDLKKKDDDFSFSEEIDLTPFLSPPPRKPSTNLSSGKELKSARYRLFSVVVHTGNLAEGHYTSFSLSDRYSKKGGEDLVTERRARRWVSASDEEIRACDISEIKKPYMLFYERIDDDAVLPKSRI